jgi:hypothetical protein
MNIMASIKGGIDRDTKATKDKRESIIEYLWVAEYIPMGRAIPRVKIRVNDDTISVNRNLPPRSSETGALWTLMAIPKSSLGKPDTHLRYWTYRGLPRP